MSDILNEAANAFHKVQNYDYIYTLGNRKRKIVISVISNSKNDFTHIFGLDHLKDIPSVTALTSSQKSAVFRNIMKGNITFEDIEKSKFLYAPLEKTLNLRTNKPYTIFERIQSLRNIEQILDSSYKGEFYKWDIDNCQVVVNGKENRYVKINANYLLKVPSQEYPQESYYFFLYQQPKSKAKDAPIKLNVFSAFPDCVDLAAGQKKTYTILREVKKNIKNQNEEILFTHNAYKSNDE